jgi:2-polyprenyl-6-methoxyphenol hydroxylase-like FAD-dependent oxidoreductase
MYKGFRRDENNLLVELNDSTKIECDYLVAADGVKSKIRHDLGLEMIGERNMMNFVNIHFKSKSIGDAMLQAGEVGMLYYLYSEELISVLVCHDLNIGEFVLQVPYYPPAQSLEDFSKK